VPQVRLVAVAAWLAEGEGALVDPRHRRRCRVCNLNCGGGRPWGWLGTALIAVFDRGDACRKSCLDGLWVFGGQSVLRRQDAPGPDATAVPRLAGDGGLRARLGAAARRRFEQRFTGGGREGCRRSALSVDSGKIILIWSVADQGRPHLASIRWP